MPNTKRLPPFFLISSGMYNVRKTVNGISKPNVKNGYNNNNNSSSSNNNSNMNINNKIVDNGTSELADQKQ